MESHPTLNLSHSRTNFVIYTLLGLVPLLGMGVDLIAPSLPAISRSLNVTTTLSKNLISIYLFGLALGNFFIGFASDALGRQKLMIGNLAAFMLISLLPTIFPNAAALLLTRFVQGFAIGAFAVLARAIFSDTLTPERLMRTAIMMATMWGIGPIIGPFIGGYLQFYFGWKACFYFFAIYCMVGLVFILPGLPETHHKRQALNLAQLKNNFKEITNHRVFIGLTILMGGTYSGLIAFNTLGPFLVQTTLGHSPIYFGHVALVMGASFLVGTLLCRFLVRHYAVETLFVCTGFVCIVGILAALLLAHFATHSLPLVLAATFMMFLGCGIVYPGAMGKCVSLFRHLAGSASAIMNVINLLITSLTSILMSFIDVHSIVPMIWTYAALIAICTLSYWVFIKKPQTTSSPTTG